MGIISWILLLTTSCLQSFTEAQTTQLLCETGWVHMSARCYLIVPNNHTWLNARTYCSKYGAFLAEPKGYEISQALYDEALSVGVTTYWIGYNRLNHETDTAEKGYWSDDHSTRVEVGVWAPRQPDISAGSCVYVSEPMTNDQYARWYMDNCENVFPFVCERTPCPIDTFTCSSGRCVSFQTLCNSANDCGDSSDERDCASLCNEFHTGESGSIAITNDEKYVPYMNCLYTIETDISKRIQIQFTTFETEEKLDVLEIWDGGATIQASTLMTRLSGTDVGIYQSFVSSTNHLVFRFTTDGSAQKSGFNINWSTEFRCEISKVTEFRLVDGQTGYTKTLTQRQTVENCISECNQTVSCWGFTYDVNYLGEKSCFIITEPPVIERDTCCELYVKTCPGREGASSLPAVPLTEPHLQAMSTSEYLFTPLYPFYYIGNMELKYTITTTGNNLITLQIMKVDLCCTDQIYIYDGNGPSAPRLATIQTSTTPGFVISTGQTMYIHMDLQKHWSCTGVIMTYVQGCNIEMTADSGEIISPGYGATTYPGIMDCSWRIIPQVGNSVRLTFTDLETEDSMDYLKIFKDDANFTELHSGLGYHGNMTPPVLTSADPLVLQFTTSAVGNYRGFRAVYSSGCPSVDSAGIVITPAASSFHAPDEIIVSCEEGYSFGGSHTGETSVPLACETGGQWNMTVIPFCEQSYCGLAPDLDNGYAVIASGVLGGDIIQYACNDGYDLIGQEFVTCQSDGNWGEIPVCTSPQCRLLSSMLSDTSFVITNGNGTEHGTIAKVTCPEYEELIGPETIFCDKGEWKSSIPTCRPIPCPVPTVVNAFLNLSQTFELNSNLFLECDMGFAIPGAPLTYSGYFHCGVEDPLVCANINECEAGLDGCIGATCHDTDGSYTCTCLPGYRPVGTSTTLCEDIDECSSGEDFCDQICTNLPGSYECSCGDGFDLYTSVDYNGFELGTEEDGSEPWHQFHLNHSCVLKTCDSDQIISIPNGKPKTSKSIFFYGDQVEYVCDIGFSTPDTGLSKETVTCRNDGMWSNRPGCDPVYCDETFGNTDVQPQGPIQYNSTYTLQCTMENGDIKVVERLCGFDSVSQTYKTFGPELVCPVTDCGPVPQPAGMRDFVTPCTEYNCTVVFECEEQYVRRGSGSVWAPFIVICTANGTWDFGDLHCEGGQCPDPGYPENGFTNLATWDNQGVAVPTVENGSVASFTCLKDGYFPSPVSNITCRPDGSTMRWDGEVPECVDLTPPMYGNCPGTLTVQSFGSIEYEEPTFSDNTAVKTLDIFPENFQPGVTADRALNVFYIAEDYNGNANSCIFQVLIQDVVPPVVICNTPGPITAFPGNEVDTEQYVTTDGTEATLRGFPSSVPADYDDVNTNPIVLYVATDSFNNIATCRNQLKIEAPKCNPETLHVYNGNIQCQLSELGYACSITCLENYVFYEDPTADELFVSCLFGGEWSREMPICTAKDLAFYRVVNEFKYPLSQFIDSSCAALYEDQIRNNLLTVTNAFTELCADVSTLIRLDVSPGTDIPIDAQIDSDGDLLATLIVDIAPEGLEDDIYKQCESLIFHAINGNQDAVSSIRTLPGGDFCSQTNLETFSADQSKSMFACTNAATAAAESSTRHTCLACPPGTFKDGFNCSACPAGTYNDGYYRETCTLCPNETNSQSTGLMYSKSCYTDCGLYLYSSDGKAPCTDCPINTYWTNSTYCTPCPANTHTKSRGAVSPNECIAECGVGRFSSDGLEPCTPCPKSYYQPSSYSTTCIECPTNEITNTIQAVDESECIDGFDSNCVPNPCGNGGVCSVVRHNFFCDCAEGFTGRRCETEVGSCDLDPCYNGGICVQESPRDHICVCAGQYTGDHCEIDVDDCVNITCQNNGTCIDQRGEAICACSSYSGYHGSLCQFTQSPCSINPCENNGRCVEQANFYRVCDCLDGFTGVDCEVNLDECSSSPCMNGGACIDSAGTFNCICSVGFDGKYCHLRDNSGLCGVDVCVDGEYCIDDYIAEERYCVCSQGFYYDETTGTCGQLISYCDNLNCGTNGECFTYDGGYNVKCKCDIGYAGELCGTNVNDCSSFPCKNGGICTDGVNNFTCQCTQTGTGGLTCEDNVDGCQNCTLANTDRCFDFVDDYRCYCLDGYTGYDCETKIPLCDSLPCQHNGSCENGPDSDTYECTCTYPWTGVNCDTEINFCANGTECQNGGTCLSTSDGFICQCDFGYIGERCEEEYNPCNRLKPCVGNSTCFDDAPPFPMCTCPNGYTGLSCESLVWFCTDSTCRNGGTCTVDQNTGVMCACPEGFTSSDCSVNIDECDGNTCPTNSVCVDDIGTYKCACQNGKIGEDCQKDFSYDFDYIINKLQSCTEDLQFSPFSLPDTSAISIAFWFRTVEVVSPDSILTVYGSESSMMTTSENWISRMTLNGTHVSFELRVSNTLLQETLPWGNRNVLDGLWHHLTVTWSNVNGYLTLYVDGLYRDGETIFAKNENLPQGGSILLGSEVGATVPFTGRISRFFVFNSKLNDSEVFQVFQGGLGENSILDQINTLMMAYTVDYNSQYSSGICTAIDNCPDKAFNLNDLPVVASCPEDLMVVTERISLPTWPSPTFTNTDSSTQTVTHLSGETGMSWGIHGIGIAEYTGDNKYAAVCTFRLYNRRAECAAIPSSNGMIQVCETPDVDDTRICTIDCDGNDISLTLEGPVYYTCSKYGMWDRSERLAQFEYPACSVSVSPTTTLTTSIQYTMVPDCESLKATLQENITQSVTHLDGKWSNDLCVRENGDSDSSCQNVDVQVACDNAQTATAIITMLYLGNEVGFGSTMTTPENAMKIGFADDSVFVFEPEALPVLSTLVVSPVQTCSEGRALVYDTCVQCGSGTYYNNTTQDCVMCSKGSYRTVTDSTPSLSTCTQCPGSETTANTGSQSSTQCFLSCFYGNYYNSTTDSCEPCPIGFYNDVIGAYYCSPCGFDETTRTEGNINTSACIAFSALTTTSPSTPAAGASTEEDGLSGGIIAVIVICSLIFLLLIILLVLCLTKKLPCFAEKVVPGETPWKHVNKYGETNLRHVNYRLSDIKEKKIGDKVPIYPQPSTPEDTLSMKTDISIHVPVFVEKLNGSISKKNLFISNGKTSEIVSDLDRTTGSEKGLSETGRLGTSMRSEEFHVVAHTLPSHPRKHYRHGRKGRPPADLTPKKKPHPRTLSPIAHSAQVSVVPETSEYVRPFPSNSQHGQHVGQFSQYVDYLETKLAKDGSKVTPPNSQSSERILLDSDDDDYR